MNNSFGLSGMGGTNRDLHLVAHARQFSCFMMLLGRIGPENTFEPKHAILLQNKDDLKIPLLLETLPTPKEFKDAIESLSPEQQNFAKAFRSMQVWPLSSIIYELTFNNRSNLLPKLTLHFKNACNKCEIRQNNLPLAEETFILILIY